jgi:hypothetical protein
MIVSFNFLFGWSEGYSIKKKARLGWKNEMDEGPPWLVVH